MRVAVCGLWHLGSVTCACLAAAGHDVVGLDDDPAVVTGLGGGVPPILEPGLPELLKSGIEAGRLRFTTTASDALAGADVLWVTYDTPVDENDVADTAFVTDRVKQAIEHVPPQCLIVVSSQLPVGSVRELEEFAASVGRSDLSFGCSPENLRLGNAIEVFSKPDRVVFGARAQESTATFAKLLAPITTNILAMGVESAEMTKHAINSFLAMSVAFANEIAIVCERVGADANEVARGLKSETRIGPKAYLRPGSAFAGGTLARDIAFVSACAKAQGLSIELIPAVGLSNMRHREWALQMLTSLLDKLDGRIIAILGLTYKPGTNTLRRSSSAELARRLSAAGAYVRAFDPALAQLPPELNIELASSAKAALEKADAVVVATEWPEFRELDWPRLLAGMAQPILLDPNSMLVDRIAGLAGITYISVGRISTSPKRGQE